MYSFSKNYFKLDLRELQRKYNLQTQIQFSKNLQKKSMIKVKLSAKYVLRQQ